LVKYNTYIVNKINNSIENQLKYLHDENVNNYEKYDTALLIVHYETLQMIDEFKN